MADQQKLPSKHHQLQIQTIGFSNLDNGRINSEVPEEQPVRIDQNKLEYPVRDNDKPTDIDQKDSLEITDYKDEPEEEKYTYTPVLTVTKNEITLTKGELKLQKIIVQESDNQKQPPNVIKTADIDSVVFNSESKNERNIVSEVPAGPGILRVTREEEDMKIEQNKEDKIKTNSHKQDDKSKDVQVIEGNTNETNNNEEAFQSLDVSESEKTVEKPEIEVKEQEEEVVYNKPVSRLPKRIPGKSAEPPKKVITKESKEVKQTATAQPFYPPTKHVGRKNIHSETPSEPQVLRQEPPTKTTSKLPKLSKHEVKTESKIPKPKSESKVRLDAKAKTEAKADEDQPKDKPRKTFKQKVLKIINIKDNSRSDIKSDVPDSPNEIRFPSEQDSAEKFDKDIKHANTDQINEDTSNIKDSVDNEPKRHTTAIKRVVKSKEQDPLRQFGHGERNSVIIEQIIGSEVPKEIDDIFDELYDSLDADKVLDEVEIGLPVIIKEDVKNDEPAKVGVVHAEQMLRQEKNSNIIPASVTVANEEEPKSIPNRENSQEIEKTEVTIPNSENSEEHDATNFEREMTGPQSILEITKIENYDILPHHTTTQDVRQVDQEQYETYDNEIKIDTENEMDNYLNQNVRENREHKIYKAGNEINNISDSENADVPEELLIEQVEKHETIDNIKYGAVYAPFQITPQKESEDDISKHFKESETIHMHRKNELEIKDEPTQNIPKSEDEVSFTDIKETKKETEDSLPHTENVNYTSLIIPDNEVDEISEYIEEVRKDLHLADFSERQRLETNEIAKDKGIISEAKSLEAIDRKEDYKKDDYGSARIVPVINSTPNDLHDNMKSISKDIPEENTPVDNIEGAPPKVIENIKETISDKLTEGIPENSIEHIIKNAENFGDVLPKDIVNTIEIIPDTPIESDYQVYMPEQTTFDKDIPKATEVPNNYSADEIQTTVQNKNEDLKDITDLPKDIEIVEEEISNETIEPRDQSQKTTESTEAEISLTVVEKDADILKVGRTDDIENEGEIPLDVKQMQSESKEIYQDIEEIPHHVKEKSQDVKEMPWDAKDITQDVIGEPQDVKEIQEVTSTDVETTKELEDDSVYTPVLTVTKKETVLTSPTVKLQKITVDEKFEDGATPRDEGVPVIKVPVYEEVKDVSPLSPELDLSKPNYRDSVRQKMKEISDRSSTDSNQIDKMKRDENIPKEVKYPPKEYVRVKTLDDVKINRDIYKPKIVDHLRKRDVTDEIANENTDSLVGNNISAKIKDDKEHSTEEEATMDLKQDNFKKIDDEINEVRPQSIKGRVKQMINKIVNKDMSPNDDIKKTDTESKVDKMEERSDKSSISGKVKSALKRFESKDESVSKDTKEQDLNDNRQTEEAKAPKKKIFAILSKFENKQSNFDRFEFKKSTEHVSNHSREVIWEKSESKPKHFKSEDDLAKEASKGKVKHILKAIEANQVGLSKGKSMENIPRTMDFRRELSRRKSVSETIAMFEVANI